MKESHVKFTSRCPLCFAIKIKESDLSIKEQKRLDENNCPVIEIRIENKKAISDDKSNYIKVLIKNIGSIKKENIDENIFNIRFYSKSISSVKEREIKTYSNMEKNNTRDSSSKRVLRIRKLQLSTDNSKPTFIDATTIHIPKKSSNSKKRPRLKYVLNLRGMLYFLLLCDRKKVRDKKMINAMIESISNSDVYTDLIEEIDNKCLGFKVERLRGGGEFVNEQRELKPMIQLNKPKIKNKFPFLSYYNEYKRGLPEDFLIDFLFYIAFRYKDNLKSKRTCDLKYEVTEEYLKHIRNSLYNPLYPKISYLALEKEQYDALKSLQVEIKTYIDKVKDKTKEIEVENEQFIDEQFEKLEFKRKFYNLISSNEPIISISSIMPSKGYGGHCLTGVELSLIDQFIKYGTEDAESYFSPILIF